LPQETATWAEVSVSRFLRYHGIRRIHQYISNRDDGTWQMQRTQKSECNGDISRGDNRPPGFRLADNQAIGRRWILL